MNLSLFLYLSLLSIVDRVTSDTFHIVTSPTAPCPGEFIGEPCLTLQQYVSNPSISNTNITLLFEAGNHTMSSTLSTSNAMELIISGSNSFIQCTSSSATLTFSSVQHITISGLHFIRCDSISISTATNILWSNLTFSQGGVLSVSEVQQLNIEYCIFQYITGNSAALILSSVNTANITQCDFSNNRNQQHGGRGGALYLHRCILNISNSYFYRNSIYRYGYGGAIHAAQYTTITVTNTSFQYNSPSTHHYYASYGGAIYVASSGGVYTFIKTFFLSNHITRYDHGYGGAIYKSGSILTLANCNFTNNNAGSRYGYGGAIYTWGTHLNINNSTFIRNTAGRDGGALHSRAQNTIRNTTFTMNIGRHGGALYTLTSVNYHQCEFITNTVYGNGGGIYVSSRLNMSNTTFHNNRAYSSGGGIYIYSSSHIFASVSTTMFLNNMATYNGSGIYISSGSHVSANIDSSLFHANIASSNGGGMYVTTSLNGFLNLIKIQCTNNLVEKYGGSIYSAGSNLSIHIFSSFFSNNSALTLGGGVVYTNSRYSNITLTSSIFSYNSASYCSVLDVDEYYHFSVNLTDSVFTHNTATGQLIGGGVACIRNASIYIIRSTFKHNYADLHGGVFYIDESDTSVDGSLFVNNSAAVDGGVFYTYVHASNYNIRRSQFSLNSAGDDGGVLFIGRVNSRVNIDECVFNWNDASDRGGVIAIIASSMYMEINRTNLFNNTALYGGIISACNSEVTVLEEELFVSTDPVYSFCTLYDGDVTHFNITAPQDLEEVTTTSALHLLVTPSGTEQVTFTSNGIISEPTSSIIVYTPDISFTLSTASSVMDNVIHTATTFQEISSRYFISNSITLSSSYTNTILNSDGHDLNTKSTMPFEYSAEGMQDTSSSVSTTIVSSTSLSTNIYWFPFESPIQITETETSLSTKRLQSSSFTRSQDQFMTANIHPTTQRSIDHSSLNSMKFASQSYTTNFVQESDDNIKTTSNIASSQEPHTISDKEPATIVIIQNANGSRLQLNIITAIAILSLILTFVVIIALAFLIIKLKLTSKIFFCISKSLDDQWSIYEVKKLEYKDDNNIDMNNSDFKEKEEIFN